MLDLHHVEGGTTSTVALTGFAGKAGGGWLRSTARCSSGRAPPAGTPSCPANCCCLPSGVPMSTSSSSSSTSALAAATAMQDSQPESKQHRSASAHAARRPLHTARVPMCCFRAAVVAGCARQAGRPARHSCSSPRDAWFASSSAPARAAAASASNRARACACASAAAAASSSAGRGFISNSSSGSSYSLQQHPGKERNKAGNAPQRSARSGLLAAGAGWKGQQRSPAPAAMTAPAGRVCQLPLLQHYRHASSSLSLTRSHPAHQSRGQRRSSSR